MCEDKFGIRKMEYISEGIREMEYTFEVLFPQAFKGLFRSLKGDIYVTSFVTILCDFLQFFREITGNESEWFSDSLRFDHAILQRWEENC